MAGESLYALSARTTHFGQRRTWTAGGRTYSDVHKGDDYALTYGNDDVYAVTGGEVVAIDYSSVFGQMVWVQTSTHRVRYHMLQRGTVAVRKGQRVSAFKTRIGRTGASAANATGNHVHIQIESLRTGLPEDPRPHIVRHLPGGKPAGSAGGSKPSGGSRVVVDGIWGRQTVSHTQRILGRSIKGVAVDGVWGPQSVRALQRSLGEKQDGQFGPVTKRAWQRRLKVAADGNWGPVSVRKLQQTINAADRIYV